MLKWISYDWFGLNQWLFLALHGRASPSMEPAMRALSLLGDYRYFPIYLAVGIAIAWRLRRLGRREEADGVRNANWRLLLGYAVGFVLVGTLKVAIDAPRPDIALGVDVIRSLGDAEPRYSLPSGHAAFVALLSASLWPVLRLYGRAALTLLAVAVGLSRICLGAHFPADVIAGYLCGIAAGWLAHRMLRILQDNRAAGIAFMIALAVALLDQSSKTAAVLVFDLHESIPVMPHLNFGYWQNTGAAFSVLASASGWQRPLFIFIGIAAAYWLGRLILAPRSSPIERSAYALILGGAVANVFDRVFRGAVVDWIDLYWTSWHWPAFNAADMGITVGASVIILVATMSGPTATESVPTASRESERSW